MAVQHEAAQQRIAWVSIVLSVAGVGYTLIGLALILAPLWFFDNIGPFAPYNRHYEGDLGMFLLPLGLGLLAAAREPARHRLLLAVAAAASLLHAANHLYDALTGTTPAPRVIQDVGPLIALGLLVLAAWWGTRSHSSI
jgi:hypothetical protein